MKAPGTLMFLFFLVAKAIFLSEATAQIPAATGWYSIPNTKLRSVCPPDNWNGTNYPFTGYCNQVTNAWNSAVLDTARNRLVIWGGGHADYYGNEIYTLNLSNLTMTRLNNPGLPLASDPIYASSNNHPEALADGTPNARHTYDGLAYMANIDKMFVFGGSLSTGGQLSGGTWLFNFGTNTWENKTNATGVPGAYYGVVTAYDPNTGKVFIHNTVNLFSYDYISNSYTQLSHDSFGTDYHLTAAIDPINKRFVMIGGGQAWWYDLAPGSKYVRQTLPQAGASSLISMVYPGLDWDPIGGHLVGWNGGDNVYSYSWATSSWSTQTYPGGPAVLGNGTQGRWAFSPASRVFVTYNSVDSNAYSLRLAPPSGDTAAPTVPSNLTASPVSSSQINLSWTASTDNTAVTGYNIYRGGSLVGASVTNSYSDTLLTGNTSYTYTVAAYDAAGNLSGQSASASATTFTVSVDNTAPSVPSNLTATSISAFQINLVWTASTDNVGVVGYKIYRAGTQIATSGTNSYSDAGLAASTSYSYTVAAYDAAGNASGQSGSASATTQSASSGPPSTGSSSSFQLTSTQSGTLPFMVGLAFKKGDIPNYPTLDIAESQVVVKRRWNDGSVKHAIASGQVGLTANVPKTLNVSNSASGPSGTSLTSANIQAANPSASVQLGSIGTVSLGSLLASPFRTWISGPEMVECHYRSNVGSDTSLSVWFHVRLYKAGRIWVRAIVENGYVGVSANKSYVPTVTIAGTTVYNNGGAALNHYANTRWTQEGWIGGDPAVTPKHNTQYLIDTKLVPNYWKRNPSAAVLNSMNQTYIPMGHGALEPGMGSAGYQPGIGLLTSWDALYVTSGDARAYRSSLANSSSINSYPIVWRNQSTQLVVKPSDNPTPLNNYSWTAGAYTWEMNHYPSEGYLSYLITGDYWHYETMLMNSAMSLMLLNGVGGRGSGLNCILTGETRGTAWNIRTLAQLGGLAPSGDAVAAEYQTLLSNNIAFWKTVKNSLGGVGIGDLYEYGFGYGSPGEMAPWQQHFWDQSMGMGSDVEPLANMTTFNEVRDFLYKFPVGILGDSSSFYFTYASSYTIKISDSTSTDPTTFYTTWLQVWNGTVSSGLVPVYDNTLKGGSGGGPNIASQGYWGNLMPAIAYAVDHGAAGAAAAWARLTGATNWSTIESSGFDDTPQWGIIPRAGGVSVPNPPPSPPTNLTVQAQ
jgi:chitodextrinase